MTRLKVSLANLLVVSLLALNLAAVPVLAQGPASARVITTVINADSTESRSPTEKTAVAAVIKTKSTNGGAAAGNRDHHLITGGREHMTVTRKVQGGGSDDWAFEFSPYVFMSGIRGTFGARGRTVEVDSNFGNILENFDFGLMGTLQAKKGKFVLVNDLMWIRMSADRDTPGALFDNAKVGANLVIIHPEAGYSVVEAKAGSLDLLGGVRIWSVENTLTVTAGTQPGFGASQRKTFVAPTVGVRGLVNVAPKFYLNGKMDVGAGSGTSSTSQFYGGFGFRINPKIALIGGYRYLQVDHDDESGFVFDTKMTGPVFGAKFSF